MSFCCGASMIGTRGTLRHHGTHIHNVPLMFCPVCHHVEVHYLIQHEYDILAQYAVSDGAYEVDFDDYLDERDAARLLDNCVNHENEDPLDIVNNQIDMALDLLAVAKYLKDEEWVSQLKERLRALGSRRRKLEQRKRKALGERK
jgi:hypothetical protein